MRTEIKIKYDLFNFRKDQQNIWLQACMYHQSKYLKILKTAKKIRYTHVE